MTLTMFLVLAGYYLLKTAREVFILSEGGAEVKSYSSAGQALLLLVLVPAYGAFASRVNRMQLVQWVTLFFAVEPRCCSCSRSRAGLHIGIVYFLWVGIFNVMVIAQFWAFAADLYTEEQGKRLFPLIGVGSSLGAWVGLGARRRSSMEPFGPSRLLIGGAAALVDVRRAGAARRSVRVAQRAPRRPPRSADEAGRAARAASRLILVGPLSAAHRRCSTLLLNVVNTSGEYLFGRYVVEHGQRDVWQPARSAAAARQQFIGATYSSYFSTSTWSGFLLQMFVVSRVFKFLGVGTRAVHPPDRRAASATCMMLRAPSFEAIRCAEDRRQQPRLLARQHHQAGAVAADEPRGEVQGQAGGRFLLRARRRRPAGRRRVRGRAGLARCRRVRRAHIVFACGWLAVARAAKAAGPRAAEAGKTEL